MTTQYRETMNLLARISIRRRLRKVEAQLQQIIERVEARSPEILLARNAEVLRREALRDLRCRCPYIDAGLGPVKVGTSADCPLHGDRLTQTACSRGDTCDWILCPTHRP